MTPVSTYLAYHALSGVLGREHRKRLVAEVLDLNRRAPADVRKRFEQAVDGVLRVGGFKHPSKAPAAKLAPEILKHLFCCRGILEALLDVWIEMRPTLRGAVSELLAGRSPALAEVFVMQGENVRGWSPELMEVVSTLKAQAPDENEDNLALMVCCLTDASQIRLLGEGALDYENDGEGNGDDDAYEPGERFGRWRSELEGVPPDAPEWDEAPAFAEALLRLAAQKLEQRDAARDTLGRAIAAFIEGNADALRFFGHATFEGWTAAWCPRGEEAALVERIESLGAAMARYNDLRALVVAAGSRAEERELRAELYVLEEEIESALTALDPKLRPSDPDDSEVGPAVQADVGAPLERNDQPTAGAEVDVIPLTADAVTAPPEETTGGGTQEADTSLLSQPSAEDVEVTGEAVAPPAAALPDAVAESETQEAPAGTFEQLVAAEPPSPTEVAAGGNGFPAASDGHSAPSDLGQESAPDSAAMSTASASPPPTPIIQTAAPELADDQPSYGFATEQPSSQIASAARNLSGAERRAALRDLVWRLIYEERHGLAFHVASGLELESEGDGARMPAWLPRAVTLGLHLRHANGDLARALREDFANFGDACFVGSGSEWDHGLRFLFAAGAMRPALLAPETGAVGVLRNLYTGQGLGAFYEWCQRVATYSDLRHPLDPNSLRRVRDAAAWRGELDSLRERVREWSASSKKRQMGKFSRATQVWRKWQESGGLLTGLLQYVAQDDPHRLEEARKEVKRLADDAEIRREIDYVDRQVLRRFGEDIIAAAYEYLRSHMREALGFVSEWIALQEARPGREQSFIQRQAEELSLHMRTRREDVLAELESFARQHPSFYVQAGVSACRAAFDNLRTLFDSDAQFSFDEPPARHLLHAELLKAPALRLNQNWEPEAGEPATLDALLELLAAGEVEWRSAFEAHAETRDHEATARVVEYLERHPDESADAAQLRQAREAAVAECREALEEDAADAHEEVQGAVASGLLREQEQLRFDDEIESALADGKVSLRFDESRRLLRGIREKLRLKREGELARVRERLTESRIAPDDPAYARIRSVLARGDAATANEYIDLTLNKEQLPPDEPPEGVFTRFFPQAYGAIAEFMEPPAGTLRPDWNRIIGDLREHAKGKRRLSAIGPVEMGRVFGKQAERAADLLEAWFTVKRSRAIDRVKAKQILTHLGFRLTEEGVAPPGPQAGGRAWLTFEAEPIRDRERCPLQAYGSNAGGRYRVLCVWDRPSEEELLNHVGDTSHSAPVIVFYFARMAESWRRNLARLCRQRRRTFAVIDDTLLLHLCGEPEPRLRAAFECALPFTFAEPYTTTAGLVPVEMFYGRERERRSLMDPMGSCFIYGGRQLGKTALLRDVERRFSTQPHKVALWFDLKTHGIGLDKNIDDMWGLLASELSRTGVMPTATSRQLTLDKFLEHVQDWLGADDERHLLLLLDEADDFLNYDGRHGGFVRVERLKGLMDKTNRRFKVVFSGLHNVQRTTRLANHPLAHYGHPLQIGPLLEGGEWREARALVERPLAALGYVFQTPDLVMRILWRTNYYPSLIQLYCQHLLKHLTDAGVAAGFDPRNSPPYVVTSRHVDDVYYSRDLRKAIRDRLIWTLQLDQRYEVIAYAMALHSHTEGARSMVEGLPVSWVRDEALYWWPEGFREANSEDSIRTLLDEMVGLGILRVVDANHYTLRSMNVVALMGTSDEIMAALLSDREAPLPYEPATFRAALRVGGTHDDAAAQRSPLTAQQESELRAHGTSVVFGCEASGLGDMAARMAAVFGAEFFINLDGTTNRAGFERKLAELAGREKGGTTLVLVPTACPWGPPWVEAALKRLKELTSKKNFVRVLFTAGPRRTWQLVGEEADGFDAMTREGLTAFSLKPWDDAAVRQWLDECRFPSNDRSTRERIEEVSGNWPLLLYRFHEDVRANPQAWGRGLARLSEAIGDPAQAQELAAAWGLDAPGPRRLLSDLLGLDWAADEELAGLFEDAQGEPVEARLHWARRLGLVRLGEDGRWRVDATVGRILAAIGE